jgi:hypothetical protein
MAYVYSTKSFLDNGSAKYTDPHSSHKVASFEAEGVPELAGLGGGGSAGRIVGSRQADRARKCSYLCQQNHGEICSRFPTKPSTLQNNVQISVSWKQPSA